MAKIITFIIFNFIAINSYAYLNMNIPMPQSGMDAFEQGYKSMDDMIYRQRAQQMQRQQLTMQRMQIEMMQEQLRQLKKKTH